MRLYDWTVTMEAGSSSSGQTCTAASPASCATALVTKGVQGHLPSEHGGDWGTGSDASGNFMKQAGTKTYLRWDGNLGTEDFTSRMKLAIDKLSDSAATFEFNENSHFGFEGKCKCVFAEGPFYGKVVPMPNTPRIETALPPSVHAAFETALPPSAQRSIRNRSAAISSRSIRSSALHMFMKPSLLRAISKGECAKLAEATPPFPPGSLGMTSVLMWAGSSKTWVRRRNLESPTAR